jgi:hypothetical protein
MYNSFRRNSHLPRACSMPDICTLAPRSSSDTPFSILLLSVIKIGMGLRKQALCGGVNGSEGSIMKAGEVREPRTEFDFMCII